MTALIRPYREHMPRVHDSAFLAANVCVIGDVEIADHANIWYGTVIRGDVGSVRIARDANIQDMCCVHMTRNVSNTVILEQASVGHNAIIHGATIEAGALIGMGSIIMDNARIGEEAIVGAGSLVTQNTVIPPRTLALGRPARVVRPLDDAEIQAGRKTAQRYRELADEHRSV